MLACVKKVENNAFVSVALKENNQWPGIEKLRYCYNHLMVGSFPIMALPEVFLSYDNVLNLVTFSSPSSDGSRQKQLMATMTWTYLTSPMASGCWEWQARTLAKSYRNSQTKTWVTAPSNSSTAKTFSWLESCYGPYGYHIQVMELGSSASHGNHNHTSRFEFW